MAARNTHTFDPLGDPLSFVNRNGQTTGYYLQHLRPDHQGNVRRRQPLRLHLRWPQQSAHRHRCHGHDDVYLRFGRPDDQRQLSQRHNRLLSLTTPVAGAFSMVDQSGYTVNYVYTPAGELSKLTDANNNPIVTYHYDAAGRLHGAGQRQWHIYNLQYDADRQRPAPDQPCSRRRDQQPNSTTPTICSGEMARHGHARRRLDL